MILLIKIVQLLFNLILLQQDLTLGGIAMKFKKTQDEFDGKLTSLSQKVKFLQFESIFFITLAAVGDQLPFSIIPNVRFWKLSPFK